MAHFDGSLKGRGHKTVTRTGFRNTGIEAQVGGWGIGGRVAMSSDLLVGHEESIDRVRFVVTSSSNGNPLFEFSLGAQRNANGEVEIYRLSAGWLESLTDDAWAYLLSQPDVVQLLRRKVFLNMDKQP